MNTKFVDKAFRFLFIFAFLLGMITAPNTSAVAQLDPIPTFNVMINATNRHGRRDWVDGQGWTNGQPLNITIDDPDTTIKPDASLDNVPVTGCGWQPGLGCFDTNFQGLYDIQAGDLVTVVQGSIIKRHEVLAIAITDADPGTDVINGTADPFSQVQVQAWDDVYFAERQVTADDSGNWSVDFTDSDLETEDLELGAGMYLDASRFDDDGDSTGFGDGLPNPNIHGSAQYDWVRAMEWPVGTVLQLSINNVYSSSVTVESGNDMTSAHFNLGGVDLQVGDEIKVVGGSTVRILSLSSIAVSEVNTSTDTVSGVGTPGAQAYVCVQKGEDCIWRGISPVEGTGAWEMYFGDIADLQSGSRGDVQERDADGDSTWYEWQVPYNPNIFASAQTNWVSARNWPVGAVVNLTINEAPIDSEIVMPSPWNPQESRAKFDLGNTDIQVGDVILVTDGVAEKSLIVTAFEVTGFDPMADTISGWATPGAGVWVGADEVDLNVQADGITGLWMADFSGLVDLTAISNGSAAEWDSDLDGTWYDWGAPSPEFMLNIQNDSSWGGLDAWNWSLGSQVTLTVDDPGTPQNPDYTEVQTMRQGNSEYHFTHAEYEVQAGDFIGHPGFTITLSDGIQEKSMAVPLLQGTEYNLETDTVSGVTNPFASVVVACDMGAESTVTADSNGNWMANFRDPEDPNIVLYDIQPGTWCEPQMYDDDHDHIVLRDWFVPFDTDGDGITDDIDNAPSIFNPDQGDVDNDGTADVLDPCPDNATNTCDTNGSAANVIGEQGGIIATPNGKVGLNIPAGALSEDISFSITDMGGSYELASDQGPMMVVRSYSIQPHGTQFDLPASITFRWEDEDDNGIVDGTTTQELQLRLIKDGLVITPACSANPDCNMAANELTVQVPDLSLFALAVPVEWMLKGFYPPADMNGVYNIVKNGSTVPLKFEIFAGSTELTNVANIKSLTYAQTSCDASATMDEIESTATGGTSLRYESSAGQFIYNWKTPSTAGKCYRVTMTATDGSPLMAYFKLK